MASTLNTTVGLSLSRLVSGSPGDLNVLVRFRVPTERAKRRPLNLSLVLDRSGSMAGVSLKQAIRAAQAVVDALDEDDTLSVVVYDDKVDTVVAPTAVRDREAIKAQIGAVRAGGTTNLSGGWLRGVELVAQHAREGVVSRVLLLTDGQANEGITNPSVLTKTAAEKLERGISTTTMGFGRHFQEDLLVGMARAGGGNFYFIQSLDEAAEVFGVELDTLKAVAAQHLTVTLTPAPGVSVVDVMSRHRRVDGGAYDLGDVYEDEDKMLGLALFHPALADGTHRLLDLAYHANAIVDGAIRTVAGTLEVTVEASAASEAHTTDRGVQLVLARLRVARAKEAALALSDGGKAQEAEATLRNLVAALRAEGLDETFEIAEEIEQLEHFAARIVARTLSGDARKELLDQAFQGGSRGRGDLMGRGVALDPAVQALPVVDAEGDGVVVVCVRESGKLRVKPVSNGYDPDANVQFPRALRAEGVRYVVDALEESADGTFYRTIGSVRRLVRAGETDPLASVGRIGGSTARVGVTKVAKTSADLEEADTVGNGVLVQVVKDGSKLRARVVQDGYEPTWNMRFPRSIREDGMLYVVDEVHTAPDGKSYIATGEIRRFVQT